MTWYLRVISSVADTDLDKTIPLVEQVLSRFDSASLTRLPENHPRGGYSLFIECRESDKFAIIETLAENGFRGCL